MINSPRFMLDTNMASFIIKGSPIVCAHLTKIPMAGQPVKKSKSLSCMDMLIAAQAIAADAVLITNDQAFYHLDSHLTLQDWST